jgi:hypothetical protein
MPRPGDLVIVGVSQNQPEWFGNIISVEEREVLIKWVRWPADLDPKIKPAMTRCPMDALLPVHDGEWHVQMGATNKILI